MLLLDSKPLSVLCQVGDFGCGDGGWTPVMKIDGNKVCVHLLLLFVFTTFVFSRINRAKSNFELVQSPFLVQSFF